MTGRKTDSQVSGVVGCDISEPQKVLRNSERVTLRPIRATTLPRYCSPEPLENTQRRDGHQQPPSTATFNVNNFAKLDPLPPFVPPGDPEHRALGGGSNFGRPTAMEATAGNASTDITKTEEL